MPYCLTVANLAPCESISVIYHICTGGLVCVNMGINFGGPSCHLCVDGFIFCTLAYPVSLQELVITFWIFKHLPCSEFDARLIGLQYIGSSQGRHADDQNNFHGMQVPLPIVSISLDRSWLTAECKKINTQRSYHRQGIVVPLGGRIEGYLCVVIPRFRTQCTLYFDLSVRQCGHA